MLLGKSPAKGVSLLAQGASHMQNKESNRLFAKMGNDIINGSTEKPKENNFMMIQPGSQYNTDSKMINLSDQKGMQIKPQELCIQLLGGGAGPTKGPIKAT